MNEITLATSTDDERCPRHEFDLEVERGGDPLDDVQGGVGSPSFDVGDVAARYSGRLGELELSAAVGSACRGRDGRTWFGWA